MNSRNLETNFDEIDSILQSVLEFDSDSEKLKLETEMLHLKTMSLIAELMKEKKMNKQDLAKELKTSKSFITQLFSADKLLNYKLLAKLQRIFKVNFTFEKQHWQNIDFDMEEDEYSPQPKKINFASYVKNKREKEYNIEPSCRALAVGY